MIWSSLRLLTRTRTLGFRLPGLSEPGLLPTSKYSMRREVCERLALWPRVLKVTGVPSSGREYVEPSSPGRDTSVSSSVGAGAVMTDSDSVGAGSGIDFFFLASPPIVSLDASRGVGIRSRCSPRGYTPIPLCSRGRSCCSASNCTAYSRPSVSEAGDGTAEVKTMKTMKTSSPRRCK